MYRELLMSRRAEITGRRHDLAAHRSADAEEQAQIASHNEQEAGAIERERQALALIDAALDRLAFGDFGLCLDCEEPIAERRLRAVPWAERCIRCQERAEGGWRETRLP